MHGNKIVNQHSLYFLTFTIVGWIDVFTRQNYRDIVIESLKICQEKKGLHVNAYVIMSNHMHIIAHSSENKLSNIIRDFKKFTSTQIIKTIKENPKESRAEWMLKLFKYYAKYNKNNMTYQFWRQYNKPIELISPKWINQKINYIHLNPVRAGIVESPEKFIYSSAKNYLGESSILDVKVIDINNYASYI